LAGSEKANALKEAFQSPEVMAWFASYQNGILPTPWDQDPAADITKL
jgi:D-methionine transport system substrate-binding protein